MSKFWTYMLMISAAVVAVIVVSSLMIEPVEEDGDAAAEAAVDRHTQRGKASRATTRSVVRRVPTPPDVVSEESPVGDDHRASRADEVNEEPESEPPSEEEVLVNNWNAAVEKLTKLQEAERKPSAAVVREFKRVFDALSEAQKVEHIPEAQNLLSDDAIDCLAAIFFDKAEPEDVLSSIYHDLLNRPEEVKMPILKKIADATDHPLSEEVADFLANLED